MARTAEQKATLRTAMVAAVLAILTAVGVHYLQQVPTAARHEAGELARALKRAAVATLELKAQPADAPELPAFRGRQERALGEVAKLGKERGLDGAAIAEELTSLPGSIERVNDMLAKGKQDLSLHAYSADPKRVAVYRPVMKLASYPVVHMLGEPLENDHADDWLLRDVHPAISTRGIARLMVDELIAAAAEPTLCPVEVRLQSHLAIGAEIDRVYREAVGPVDKEKVMPLCRRERLRRLAHEELLDKGSRFPFVPTLLMSEDEIALLERLQNPEKTPGLGGKSRSYMNSMRQADDDIHGSVQALTPIVGKLAAEVTREEAVFAAAYAGQKDERCALLAAYAASPNKVRFAASRVARLSGETWPTEPERSGLIAFLYEQAGLTPPKEALASGQQMTKLWDALSKAPPAKACGPVPEVALDDKAASTLAATLLAE